MTDAAKAVEVTKHEWVPNSLSDFGGDVCRNCGLVSEAFHAPTDKGCKPSAFFLGIPGYPASRLTAVEEPAKPTENEEEDASQCARCHATMNIPYPLEPTKYCHNCAQELVAEYESVPSPAAPGDVREGVELPPLEVTESDMARAKQYARARFGSAVVTEAFTFEDGIRSQYHDEILAVHREKSEAYCRERQLLVALQQVAEVESKLRVTEKDRSILETALYEISEKEFANSGYNLPQMIRIQAELSRLHGEKDATPTKEPSAPIEPGGPLDFLTNDERGIYERIASFAPEDRSWIEGYFKKYVDLFLEARKEIARLLSWNADLRKSVAGLSRLKGGE